MKNDTEKMIAYVPNTWQKIARESADVDEFLMGTYTKAIQECFREYRTVPEPVMPEGFFERYQDYLSCSEERKTQVWKKLVNDFYIYLKKRDEAKDDSTSHYFFLREMQDYFREKNIFTYVNQIEIRLREFDPWFSRYYLAQNRHKKPQVSEPEWID